MEIELSLRQTEEGEVFFEVFALCSLNFDVVGVDEATPGERDDTIALKRVVHEDVVKGWREALKQSKIGIKAGLMLQRSMTSLTHLLLAE